MTRRIGRDLAEAGLPDLSWYDLLWTLYRAPERRLRVNELAREVVLSPTAMSRFVDRAEKAGVVRREPDPDDRRALQVVLTDEGVALLRQMWPVYERGIEEHFAAHLGASPARLRRVLERVGRVGALGGRGQARQLELVLDDPVRAAQGAEAEGREQRARRAVLAQRRAGERVHAGRARVADEPPAQRGAEPAPVQRVDDGERDLGAAGRPVHAL